MPVPEPTAETAVELAAAQAAAVELEAGQAAAVELAADQAVAAAPPTLTAELTRARSLAVAVLVLAAN